MALIATVNKGTTKYKAGYKGTIKIFPLLKEYTFTIVQSANQTITVTRTGGTASIDGNSSWTSTFTAPEGMTWSASIVGTGNGIVPSGKEVGDSLAYGSSYVASNTNLVIPSDVDSIRVHSEVHRYDGESHDSYNIYINGVLHNDGDVITVTPGSTITYRVPNAGEEQSWSICVASIIRATGYIPGTLSATSGTVTGNYTLTATRALPAGAYGAAVYFDETNQRQAISDSILPSITKPTVTYGSPVSGIITNLQNNIYSRSIQYCSFDLNIPEGVTRVVIAPNVAWDDSTRGSYSNSKLLSSSGLYWSNGEGRDTGTWINQPYDNANSFEQKVLGTTTQYCTKGRVRYLSLSVTPGATYHMILKNSPVTEKDENHPGWNFIFGQYVESITTPKRNATAYATANATLTVVGDYGSYQFNHLYSPTGTTLATATLSAGATRTVPKGSIISWTGTRVYDYYGGEMHSPSWEMYNRQPTTYMVVNDMNMI